MVVMYCYGTIYSSQKLIMKNRFDNAYDNDYNADDNDCNGDDNEHNMF